MDFTTIALLALVALTAGFIDAIAGGGGLLALPALLLAGLDPVSALATNKLQGSFGTASATFAFWQKGHIKIEDHIPTVVATFIAACLGVLAVNYAPKNLLAAALPILLVLIAFYFALSPHLTNEAKSARIPPAAFAFGIAPFFDAGTVRDNWQDLNFTNIKTSYGGGLRIAWNQSTIISFDYGISKEDKLFYFGIGQAF